MNTYSLQGIAVLLCCLGLQACSYLDGTTRMKNPAIVDEFNPKSTIVSQAVISDRRLVIYGNGIVCPEAPPDTASNVSASVSTAISASLKAQAGAASPTATGAALSQIATALNHITNPSQGTLLMRYAFAFGCISVMNGTMNATQYNAFITAAMQVAADLTYAELSLNGGKIGGNVLPENSQAPTLSGAQVSLDTAAKAAGDATKSATKSAGTTTSTDAGNEAIADVKSKAGSDAAATVDTLASTAGKSAYDIVLKTTGNATKADTAQKVASTNVYHAASVALAAPIDARVKSVATVVSALDNAGKIGEPLGALSKTYQQENNLSGASTQEVAGFQALIAKDVDAALAAFNKAYDAYPTFHEVDEIRSLIRSRYAALKSGDSNAWKNIYITIVNQSSWHAPQAQLEQLRKMSQ